MKPTHQQLLQAVRAAGRGRASFTCAQVREQLGVSTKDRQKLNQFYRTFRAFQAEAAAELEKVGPNCYRLRAQEPELVESLASEVIEVDGAELSEVSEVTELEVVVLATTQAQAEPPRVPAWRGHMRRFGRRVRSLFGGNAQARSSREAGIAAQL
jgi:hypothetical protein